MIQILDYHSFKIKFKENYALSDYPMRSIIKLMVAREELLPKDFALIHSPRLLNIFKPIEQNHLFI